MSSAKNHKIRSHRSYKSKAAMLNNFQRSQLIKTASVKAMKEKSSLFTKLMGMLKKGDK